MVLRQQTPEQAAVGSRRPPSVTGTRRLRWWSLRLGLLLLATLAAVYPLPFTVLTPQHPLPAASVVRVTGAAEAPSNDLLLSRVGVQTGSLALGLVATLDPTREAVSHRALEARQDDAAPAPGRRLGSYDQSVLLAAAMGLRRADQAVAVTAEAVAVTGVIDGGPADGRLRAGDVIVMADETPIRFAADLAELTRSSPAGTPVSLSVRRGGRVVRVTVTTGTIPGRERPGIGILTDTLGLRVRFPTGVSVEAEPGFEGGSAGLLTAIHVYDLFTPGDLARGRRVSGTGGIDHRGRVHSVEGVQQKVIAAERAGVDLFLVPATQQEEAREAVRGAMTIVPVATVDDALAALME